MTTSTVEVRPDPPTTSASQHRRGLTLLTAVTPAVWGTTYIVTSQLLPAGHPIFAGMMRALPAGLLALVIARTLPCGQWWWKAGVLGTLNIGLFFPLLFVAAGRLPGGVAATLGASQPIIVAGLAVGLLAERLSLWRLGWGILGVAAVALIVIRPGAQFDPTGIIAGLTAPIVMGLGLVLTKRWGRPEGVGALAFAGWQLTAGGLVLLAPALLIDGVPAQVDAPAVAGYLWLGLIGGLLAYTLWFNGLRKLPVTATALLVLLSPVVAAILGAVVLHQTLTPVQIVGFVLALTAMGAGQLTPRLRKDHSSRTSPSSAPPAWSAPAWSPRQSPADIASPPPGTPTATRRMTPSPLRWLMWRMRRHSSQP